MRAAIVLVVVLLAACGKDAAKKPPSDPEAREICEKFGARWTICSKELMPETDFGTFDVDKCVLDTADLAARKKCVEIESCQTMLDCYRDEIGER